MPEEKIKTPAPRFAAHILKALVWILVVMVVVFISAFIALNYYGEHFIKKFLQVRISQTSHGVYEIDFDQLSFNLFSGKTVVTGFQLIPNEEQYEKMQKEGKAKGTLYSVIYKQLILNNLNLKEMVLDRTIHLRMIEVDNPVIGFIAYPDSLALKRGRFRHIYLDIYPLLSTVFSEVKIDSIFVNDGSFSGKETLKSGKTIEGDWLYSAVLRDFDLNAYDFKEERVFYSKDVELRIRNFNYSLTDSLYFLTADEVGFSLTGSRIFGKGLSLTPNFNVRKITGNQPGNLYQAFLPEFSIAGVDLYKAMLEKQILINSISIDNLDIRMFLNEAAGPMLNKQKKKVTIANLYTIFHDKLEKITIDTFHLNNASFEFYPGISGTKPELKVERATLQLHGFQLDSLAHLDTTKILYSNDIEFDLEGFTLALEDKLHDLYAQRVIISTRRSLIEVYQTKLYPSPSVASTVRYKSNSFYRLMFPHVKLEQVDILRMFNTRNLEFERLFVFEPDMTIIQFREKNVPQDSTFHKETFLQKLDIGRRLVMPYMVSIQAGIIEISNARISFKDENGGLDEERISGLVDLTVTGFRIDTLTHYDRKGFLNRLELVMNLRDFRYLSPDSLHRITVRELMISSLSRELNITGFDMLTTSRVHPGMPYPSTLTAQFTALQVQGFDHRKWISEKWFSAGDIRIHEPKIVIRSVKRKKESSLNEPFSDVDAAVSKIEIGSIRIDKGWFDLVEEDKQSRGSLLVRNFDFQLSNFLSDLTGWDKGRKILRYDLLSLSLDSARPIFLDSAYSISFSRFLSDSYPPSIFVSDLRILPVDTENHGKQKTVSVELTLPSLTIRQLDLEEVLFNRDLMVEEVRIVQPEIILNHRPSSQAKKIMETSTISIHPEVKIPFRSMEIGLVMLTDGILRYNKFENDKVAPMNLAGINTTVTGFRYDSTHSRKNGTTLFFCTDIDLRTGGYSMLTFDSMNTISMAGLHLSTGNSTLAIDSFKLKPNYSDYEYSRRLGYQTDRIEMNTVKIEVERLDFKTLFEERKVVAGQVEIYGLTFDDYRDKRVRFPAWNRPPMIQQAIRKISFPLAVDTVILTGGKVTYREQNGDEAGMIVFDRMEVLARNFISDSETISPGAELIAAGSTYLMGKAKVEGEFRFPLQSLTDTFFFQGKAGKVDMTLFNPMVSRVAPVRIKSGVVDSLNVHWIRGNDTYANGLLDLYYHDLQVELLKEKKDFLNRAGTDLIQLLLDMALPQEDPGYFGYHRSGYIWNKRNDEKGFFNFYWRSLLNGLKSGAGMNSKEQKAFKRVLKRPTKSQSQTEYGKD